MDMFKEVLSTLEDVTNVQCIEMYDIEGRLAGKLENKSGTQGSLKVYYHLYKTFGGITQDAAIEGLSLFSEHTEDAQNNPGKHPNIDRLFDILDNEAPLTVKIIQA